MDIIKQDPFRDLYDFESSQGTTFLMRPFRKADVEAVDKLVEISRGNRDVVKTENDWNVIANLVVFYIQRWPEEWKEFSKAIPQIRESRRAGGYSKSKEILYLGALPLRLERLIKTIFPFQQYNKKFMYQFLRRFKHFKVAGEGN